ADRIYEPLAARVQKDALDPKAYFPFTWQQTLYNNEPYGIPFETDVRVLYWDKNIFREVGLDPDKPPVKWDDLWAMADKLDKKNPDGTYARIGFFPLFGGVGADLWGYANGVQYVKSGKPDVTDPKVVETFEWIKKWVDRYGGWDNLQKFRSGFAAAPNDAFMSGKVAIIGDIQGYVSVINFWDPRIKTKDPKDATKELNDRLDYGVSDLPYNTTKGTWSGGFSLSIPRGAKNQDAAWEFIKCASGPDGEASWARDTFGIAPNIQANKDPGLLADPRWQFFVDALQNSKVEPFVKEYPNWAEKLGGTLQEPIWKGEKSAKDALAQAQKDIDAEIAKKK
ncbi:MAG: extracellular solute-binding protein, partial [Chloroflexi bacterium]|nr:extracellular solute-binding protein [Chloroflexota bacterium]